MIKTKLAKLVLFYFLTYGILGVPSDRPVDLKWLNLENDLDMFNKYPWGSLVCRETIKLLRGDFGNCGHHEVQHAATTYDLAGFHIAFQVICT